MTKIAELYGIPTHIDPPGSDWTRVVAAENCPYLGRKCLKNRKSEADLTIGTCTLYFGKGTDTIMICPFRLLERQQVRRWVKDTHEMSIAHLKELFIASVILKDPYDEAIHTLRSMTENIDDKEYGNFGFDVGGVDNQKQAADGFEDIQDWG